MPLKDLIDSSYNIMSPACGFPKNTKENQKLMDVITRGIVKGLQDSTCKGTGLAGLAGIVAGAAPVPLLCPGFATIEPALLAALIAAGNLGPQAPGLARGIAALAPLLLASATIAIDIAKIVPPTFIGAISFLPMSIVMGDSVKEMQEAAKTSSIAAIAKDGVISDELQKVFDAVAGVFEIAMGTATAIVTTLGSPTPPPVPVPTASADGIIS